MNTKQRNHIICLLIVGPSLSGCRSGTLPGPTLTPAPPIALTIPGVVAYYPFNGDAGDMSGNQNSGQVNGATLTTDRFGISNRAYYFDGVDDYSSFDASKMPLGTSSRTIFAWIRAESFPPELFAGLGSRATVIGWRIDDWEKLSEMQIVNGRLKFHCYVIDDTSNAVLQLNRWYHLAIVYTEASVSLYINDIRDKHVATSIDTSAGPGKIGAFPDPKTHGFDSSYFRGTIDDVSAYDQAPSEAQIQYLYTEGGWGE